ncbi:MAG: hypothetical protein ACR2OX_04275, partial [Methyloligellaceae bacterium]
FKRDELKLLDRIAEVGEFGRHYLLASLRLIAFHPVQSGISNSLRTGRAKLPLHRRVECEEASPYGQIHDDLDAVTDKVRSWLKIALSLRESDTCEDDRVAEAKQEGLLILKKSRAKSLAQDKALLRDALLEVEDPLIALQTTATSFSERVLARFGSPPGAALDTRFKEDRTRFTRILRERYLSLGGC